MVALLLAAAKILTPMILEAVQDHVAEHNSMPTADQVTERLHQKVLRYTGPDSEWEKWKAAHPEGSDR
jgi:hypothetical protein